MKCWKCGDSLILCNLRHFIKDALVPAVKGAAIGAAVGFLLATISNWASADMTARSVSLGVLTVTSYRPVAAQTKPECTSRFHCTTSIDDGVTRFGVAASQDLLQSGAVHYGDVLYVEGYGYRVVNDTMNARHRKSIDLMVFTRSEEKAVGVRKIKIYKLEAGQ